MPESTNAAVVPIGIMIDYVVAIYHDADNPEQVRALAMEAFDALCWERTALPSIALPKRALVRVPPPAI